MTMRDMHVELGAYQFTATDYDVDRAIDRYLPASPGLLRSLVRTRLNEDDDFRPLARARTVIELLVVLAHLDRVDRGGAPG
jgi:hypothetical protein